MLCNNAVTWVAALLVSSAVYSQSPLVQQEPEVVFEGRNVILAAKYYRRLKSKDAEATPIHGAPQIAGVMALEQRLPLQPNTLRVGRPDLLTVEGLYTPLFVMGMDAISLNWFSRAATGLAEIGARGIVVQAVNLDDWLLLKEQAREAGIGLVLMDGDSLAEGYNLRTYPEVLIRPELARSGQYE